MSLMRVIAWWFAFLCPAFGGGGSSSSSSTSSTTQNTDKRQVVDGNSVGVSSDQSTVNVTSTDYGSVNKAIDLTVTNTKAVGDAFGQVLNFATKALEVTQKNLDVAAKSTDQVSKAYSESRDAVTGTKSLSTTGMIVAGVVAAAFAFKAKAKG